MPTAPGVWARSSLPSSAGADDGKLTVLTCRPTAGLTAAGCDTIIADFVARNDSGSASAARTRSPTPRFPRVTWDRRRTGS